MRLSKSVVDVGSQRVKRQPTLQVPFGASYFSAVQAPRDSNLDPLRSKTLGVLDGSPHRASECNSLLELLSNLLCLELRVQLWLMDFLNIHIHFAPGPILDLLFKLIDFSPLAADDDPRTRGVDDYL